MYRTTHDPATSRTTAPDPQRAASLAIAIAWCASLTLSGCAAFQVGAVADYAAQAQRCAVSTDPEQRAAIDKGAKLANDAAAAEQARLADADHAIESIKARIEREKAALLACSLTYVPILQQRREAVHQAAQRTILDDLYDAFSGNNPNQDTGTDVSIALGSAAVTLMDIMTLGWGTPIIAAIAYAAQGPDPSVYQDPAYREAYRKLLTCQTDSLDTLRALNSNLSYQTNEASSAGKDLHDTGSYAMQLYAWACEGGPAVSVISIAEQAAANDPANALRNPANTPPVPRAPNRDIFGTQTVSPPARPRITQSPTSPTYNPPPYTPPPYTPPPYNPR